MNIVYKVVREFRVSENKGFAKALKMAKDRNSKLFVVYSESNINNWRSPNNLSSKVLSFIKQQIASFKEEIEILKSHKDFEKNFKNVDLTFQIIKTNNSVNDIYQFCLKNNVSDIVTDYTPLREQRVFFKKFKSNYAGEVEIQEIDSKNILDIQDVSDKEEFAASTFRKKWVRRINLIDQKELLKKDEIPLIKNNSHKEFENFIKNKLENYFEDRNNALADGSSHLSYYVNFGRISRLYVLRTILEKYNLSIDDVFDENRNGSGDSASIGESNLIKSIKSFLEEFCIRFELSENYCFYNSNYDSIKGIKPWAIETLEKAKNDKRGYVYTKRQFEDCLTHDDLWNACQKDLESSGRLNGYLRMYWAKKILEWSKDPETAIKTAIYLNDKYALDGYAPTTYTGILWSIGGLHDRPWFPRPIFGNIRYMSISGVEKRFRVKDFIQKVSQNKLI